MTPTHPVVLACAPVRALGWVVHVDHARRQVEAWRGSHGVRVPLAAPEVVAAELLALVAR